MKAPIRPVDLGASVRDSARIAPQTTGNPMDWYLEHRAGLAAEFPGEWLAIVGNEVVAHASTTEQLAQQVDALGLQRVFVACADAASLAPLV